MKQKEIKKSCIKQTSNYTSQADGLITRGDMIGFSVLTGRYNDGDTIKIEDKCLTVKEMPKGQLYVIDEYGEILWGCSDGTSWYSDWASEPMKWIGPETIVDELKDLI